MEKVLKQELKDWESASISNEIVEELSEDSLCVEAVEVIMESAIDSGDHHNGYSELRSCFSGLSDFFNRIYNKQRKNYYRNPWGYQPKNIPPKVAVCSSRHKGRKCKKRK